MAFGIVLLIIAVVCMVLSDSFVEPSLVSACGGRYANPSESSELGFASFQQLITERTDTQRTNIESVSDRRPTFRYLKSAYLELHAPLSISFEHAWFLLLALARHDEVGMGRCDHCGGLRLRDLLGQTQANLRQLPAGVSW